MYNFQDLFSAAEKGDLNTLERILSEKSDAAKAENSEGLTALAVALYNSQPDALQLLINNGADINVKGNDSRSTLQWAREQEKSETAEILLLTDYIDRLFNTAVWWEKRKEKEASCDSCGCLIDKDNSTIISIDDALSTQKYLNRIVDQAVKLYPPEIAKDREELAALLREKIRDNSYSDIYNVCSRCRDEYFSETVFGHSRSFILNSIDKLFKEQL